LPTRRFPLPQHLGPIQTIKKGNAAVFSKKGAVSDVPNGNGAALLRATGTTNGGFFPTFGTKCRSGGLPENQVHPASADTYTRSP